jgi:glycosyltransferase involved in cell wall biosynthesis
VLIPTYNNDRTLRDIVLRTLVSCDLPVLVFNDGSTDRTWEILKALRQDIGSRLVLGMTERNQGKAAALQGGFTAGQLQGWTHAITLDSDDQLRPEEIPLLLQAAREHPGALVVGYRDASKADYPARSRIGRNISNFLIRLESGCRVQDSQCGFRVYPLRLVSAVRCRAGHFGFEAEIITRACRAGCEIVQVPVTCRYLPPGERVSHFRPWVDTVRGVRMHIRLVLRAWLGGAWDRLPADGEHS